MKIAARSVAQLPVGTYFWAVRAPLLDGHSNLWRCDENLTMSHVMTIRANDSIMLRDEDDNPVEGVDRSNGARWDADLYRVPENLGAALDMARAHKVSGEAIARIAPPPIY